MRIGVFGLGYVGTVSAACLAHDGHEVLGVDPVKIKVELINEGRSPIIEADLDGIIRSTVKAGRLRAVQYPAHAVQNTDLSLICVGTPSQPNGDLEITYIRRVCEQIGQALRSKAGWHVVAVRSTILPGTMRETVIPTLEKFSGRVAGNDFGVCHNPEFLREGSAVKDFREPPKTVVGELNQASGEVLAELYRSIEAPFFRTDLETAEMVKFVDNPWHALKIGFANEIGNLCKSFGVDSRQVMDIFCRDTKLNISPAYLKPGFAFGGSCLSKDLRALASRAGTRNLELPILTAILPSNEKQIARGVQLIADAGHRRVGILGFSFKAGTDDLRESPVIEVIGRLIQAGFDLRIYDQNVSMARLVGSNREFILKHIPHISGLMVEGMSAVLEHAQTVVIGNNDPAFQSAPQCLREDQVLVDFVGMSHPTRDKSRYAGICW